MPFLLPFFAMLLFFFFVIIQYILLLLTSIITITFFLSSLSRFDLYSTHLVVRTRRNALFIRMNEFRGMRVINDEIKMVEKIQIEKVREKKRKTVFAAAVHNKQIKSRKLNINNINFCVYISYKYYDDQHFDSSIIYLAVFFQLHSLHFIVHFFSSRLVLSSPGDLNINYENSYYFYSNYYLSSLSTLFLAPVLSYYFFHLYQICLQHLSNLFLFDLIMILYLNFILLDDWVPFFNFFSKLLTLYSEIHIFLLLIN